MGDELKLDIQKQNDTLNINNNINKYINNKYLNNININIKNTPEKSIVKAKNAERIAWQLQEIFNNPEYFKFYLKVAYTLPENKIWLNVEMAREAKRTPSKLFTWLCKKDMSDG